MITALQTDDEEMDSFLFSLGCYSGERITVVSRNNSGRVIAVNGRHNIDNGLAEAICIAEK